MFNYVRSSGASSERARYRPNPRGKQISTHEYTQGMFTHQGTAGGARQATKPAGQHSKESLRLLDVSQYLDMHREVSTTV